MTILDHWKAGEADYRPAFDLVQAYTLCSVFASLDMSGVLERLEEKGVRAGDLGPDETLAAATLRYLAVRGIVTETDGVHTLTSVGKALYRDRGYLMWLNGGYGEPLRIFGDFATGALRYGRDLTRDGRWVAVGSALLGRQDVVPEVTQLIGRVDYRRVVDLGCGNAHFLIKLVSEADGSSGVGVDISPEACEEANLEIRAAHLEDRLEVACADAADPAAIPDLEHTELVVTFFFLHEVLGQGYDALVGYLRGLGDRLPKGAHILTAEVTPPDEDAASAEPFSPEFTLVHALMRQTLLSEAGWRQAFGDAGFEVTETLRPNMPGGLLVLARNVGR
jgi:SAM-dependent methyltransferase